MSLEAVARLNSALEGRYRVERELGAGGIATVYLAHDVRHDRKVALKVLKPEFAAVVSAQRFLEEVRATASLQHPHILPLLDSGEARGYLFVVSPFVEGESLRQKIDREKQLSVRDAVGITLRVAEALDQAHAEGLVHRDLKPSNILLGSRGEPLVSDVGLAHAVARAGGGRVNEAGLSLGTPHYMSPEQATGDREVDARSDVFSLGCVFYEMLTGQPPFAAPTAQAVLLRVLTSDAVPIPTFRHTVPEHLVDAVDRSLEKLPADRFESAQDFAMALANPSFRYERALPLQFVPRGGVAGEGPAHDADDEGRGRRPWWERLVPWAVAAGAVALAVGVYLRSSEPEPVTRVLLGSEEGQEFREVFGADQLAGTALSPDGARLIYRGRSVTSASNGMLWIRDLASLEAAPISGTQGGYAPLVSADGDYLAFIQTQVEGGARLSVLSFAGGNPLWLEDFPAGIYAWGDDGAIYFAADSASVHRWVPGEAQATTLVPPGVIGDEARVTSVLPGSGAVLAELVGADGQTYLAAVSLEDQGVHDLALPEARFPRFVPTGHVSAVRRDGTLVLVPFHRRSLEVTGPAVATGDVVLGREYTFSEDGTLVYLPDRTGSGGLQQLVWVSRGGEREYIDWITAVAFEGVSISPEQGRIAAGVQEGGGMDVWVFDLGERSRVRLTRDASSTRPAWHPTGDRLLYSQFDSGELREIRPDGVSESQTLLSGLAAPFEGLWSPDGRELIVRTPMGRSFRGVFRVPPGSGNLLPFLDRSFDDTTPQPSLDGRWLVYASDESGQYEVYAQPYPWGGTPVRISVDGGSQPVWSRDGSEVFYIGRDNGMWAARVRWTAGSFEVLTRERLFDMGRFRADPYLRHFDVDRNGRFLFVDPGDQTRGSLVLVRNWFEEVKALASN